MQRQPFYIIQSGTISRKNNTILFENESVKKSIPIEGVDAIFCLGEVTINSKLLTFLSKQGIVVHFFNYYGYYTGSFYPKETLLSGSLVVKQVEHYLDASKRLFLAKSFVYGTVTNLIRILEHYRKHSKTVGQTMEDLERCKERLDRCISIPEIMQLEGSAWNGMFGAYEQILRRDFVFDRRSRQPPHNEINCLISFFNSLLYTATLTEIYHTQLHPTISYLHEPFERRFSLALDLSEMFKPLITQRAMLKLVNKMELKPMHFRKDVNGCMLTEEGKKIVVKEFDDRLRATVDHPTLKRLVSHRRLIRLEAYKLAKHLIDDKKYEPFVMWW